MDAHPQDEFLPLRWKELEIHLVGHVRTADGVRYRLVRNVSGRWCVVLRLSDGAEVVQSPWCPSYQAAVRWLKRKVGGKRRKVARRDRRSQRDP